MTMPDQLWTVIISSVFGGLTGLVTLVFSLMERRARMLKDLEAEAYRKKLAADLEVATEAAKRAEQRTAMLQQTVISSKVSREKQIKVLGEKIDANTDMNKEALDAANGVNKKIESIGLEFKDKAAPMQAANVTIEAGTVDVHTPGENH